MRQRKGSRSNFGNVQNLTLSFFAALLNRDSQHKHLGGVGAWEGLEVGDVFGGQAGVDAD